MPKAHARPPRPRWSKKKHELRVGRFVVKRFGQPSPIQEAILDSFEELGWPKDMDDPLTHKPGIRPKERLHDALKRLNNHHLPGPWRIRFHGNGQGNGIWWEVVPTRGHIAAPAMTLYVPSGPFTIGRNRTKMLGNRTKTNLTNRHTCVDVNLASISHTGGPLS